MRRRCGFIQGAVRRFLGIGKAGACTGRGAFVPEEGGEELEPVDVTAEDLIAVRERLHEAYEGNADDKDEED